MCLGVIGSGGNGEGEEEELVSRSPTPTPTPILNKVTGVYIGSGSGREKRSSSPGAFNFISGNL